ncbi:MULTISPECIES: hypothetical protein [Pseudomonas]|uniref:hypothetical protein n=1 Tax=Pseudomonas TaxID=286 RepID=UPI0015B76B7B|nr:MULTISPECIES: hypothetical protein [Pseudomonas]MBF8677163.1 hypothetical protein [Pseudomonas fulva]MBF8699491.1 hypothetical protein [Pseudomonas fulva]MBI6926459.1 hypothetical protein [Pseudomonas putida]
MVISVSEGVGVILIVGSLAWGIPNLFKKRSALAGIVRSLGNTQGVGAAHPPE